MKHKPTTLHSTSNRVALSARERIQRTRLARLRQIIDATSPETLAARLGITPTELAHIAGTRPVKAISDQTARHIEAASGAPPGWLDGKH